MEMIRQTNGKFFTVKTRKKDGSIRKFVGRTRVSRYLVGGEPSYDREALNHVCIWEQGKGYRTINVETAHDFKCGKNRF